MNKAIEIAAEKAGIDEYRIVELPKMPDPLTQIINEFTGDAAGRILKNEFGAQYVHYRSLNNLLKGDRIQARIPFEITVH